MQISSAVPAEIAESARNHAEATQRQPTQEELATAQQDLIDKVIAGQTVAGFDLAAVLDCELNSERPFTEDMAKLLGSLYEDSGSTAGLWLRVHDYLSRTIAHCIPQSAIEDEACAEWRYEK